MGRTSKPKDNDIPTISVSRSGSLGGAPPATSKCPITFQTKVKKTGLTREGVPVFLDIKAECVLLRISGTEIGKLNSHQAKTVIECNAFGVRYKGKIIVKTDIVYARFERIR
jgi:hypothetical protein